MFGFFLLSAQLFRQPDKEKKIKTIPLAINNALPHPHVNPDMQRTNYRRLKTSLGTIYLSHEIQLRNPNANNSLCASIKITGARIPFL